MFSSDLQIQQFLMNETYPVSLESLLDKAVLMVKYTECDWDYEDDPDAGLFPIVDHRNNCHGFNCGANIGPSGEFVTRAKVWEYRHDPDSEVTWMDIKTELEWALLDCEENHEVA